MRLALGWVTLARPPTEDGQEYMLSFRNLGLVTPCPRLASVFYLIEIYQMFDFVPPAYPLGIWEGSCGLITLSAVFISFFFIVKIVARNSFLSLILFFQVHKSLQYPSIRNDYIIFLHFWCIHVSAILFLLVKNIYPKNMSPWGRYDRWAMGH